LPRPQQSPGTVGPLVPELGVEQSPGTVESAPSATSETPFPTRMFALHITIDERTHDKLRHAQTLLSHAVPSGELAEVLDRALDVLIERLEKRKFAATANPRLRPRRGHLATVKAPRARCIPADVRRAVWERDQGQCTFIGQSGRRCPSRKLLEFDHIDPVARGGRASVDRLRLRCRAHNQFEAERAFGVEFMRGKREAARARAAARARVREEARESADAHAREQAREQARDVVSALRGLGLRADEARRAAELAQSWPTAALEEWVRAALKFHRPRQAYGARSGQAWAHAPVHSP
jgi:5-methylcytosine-specific restriction endonuclease McrA